ncbi:istB domain protein ATP-binding protein [Clostridium sp. CAG:575]|nr:istB domain protein ATP-binding protein [Clostridium sp. CAG:575]
MSNEILNSLLREYEQKKLKAELDLEKRKEQLYKLIPRLEEIDKELNSSGINAAKQILFKSADSSIIDSLNNKIENLKKEKEKILIENNYSIDYLKPFYDCKICNDTGFILDDNYKTKMCNCLKQKLLNISFNKSNMYNLEKENFNNFNSLIFSDDVDLAKYKFNISPRRNIDNIKNKCIQFVNNFDNPEYKNLLFVGSTGLR